MNIPVSSSSAQRLDPHSVAIDPGRFRSVMGAFATGVTVITTEWHGKLYGATVNSVTSVSLHPCMLLFCTNQNSVTGAAVRQRGLFSVNILGRHQYDLSIRFTDMRKDRFEDLAVALSSDGLPLLQDAAGQLCCRVTAIHKAGDHDIILGEVFSGAENTCNPLIFHKGAYGSFSD